MLNISIIDCAIEQASHCCFNRLVDLLPHKFHYHHPVTQGLDSLTFSDQEKLSDAIIVFGSASNVADKLTWQLEVASYCLEKLQQRKPILGICFGHQLMGDQLGLQVQKNPGDVSHNGVRTISIENEKWGFSSGDQFSLFCAHSYCLSPGNTPSDFDIIASTQDCQFDIISHQSLPFLGLQCHPEASDFFVASEIEIKTGKLPKEVKEKAKADGLRVIETFLQECERLKHTP